MNKEPETYEELIRYKLCVDLTSYYDISLEDLNKIYDFLTENPDGVVTGDATSLTLKINLKPEFEPIVINTKCIDSNINGLTISDKTLKVFSN